MVADDVTVTSYRLSVSFVVQLLSLFAANYCTGTLCRLRGKIIILRCIAAERVENCYGKGKFLCL
jgi:hypothetical protein